MWLKGNYLAWNFQNLFYGILIATAALVWFKHILFRKKHSTSIAFAYNINETDQNESNCWLSFSPTLTRYIVNASGKLQKVTLS